MRKQFLYFMMICLLMAGFGCEGLNRTKIRKLASVGQQAPDFTLVDRKGKTWTLSELKGQVVFINFWASWCAPCREEMPSMQKLYTTLSKDNFKMLAIISKDNPKAADSFVSKHKLTMPVLNDESNKVSTIYGLAGLPETFIVDKQGVIREKFIGPANWSSPEYIQMMMKYINPL